MQLRKEQVTWNEMEECILLRQTTVLKKHVSGEIQNSNLQYILKFLKENNKWFL